MVSGCRLRRNLQTYGHRTVRRGGASAARMENDHQQGKKQQTKD